MAAPTILSPGAKVGGKYEVVDVIGFGGMGVVYKIREQVGAVSRIRALKTVLPQYAADKAVVARFRQEAEKMCMLEHENIVPVLSYSDEGEFPYLVMPFIEGQTLKEYLASYVAEHNRGLPLAETMEIGLEIIRGLEAAHRFVQQETQRPQPMIHRDIKPGNIMVRPEDSGGERRWKVLIMDFGIAKVLSDDDAGGHTLTEVIGTVKYAAPEQIRRHKDIDPRADIYSLGMVLYEVYSGRHLFAGVNEHGVLMRMMQKDVQDYDVTFPDEAPERFRELIGRAIAVDRDRRFANVGEMRTLMRRILDEDTEQIETDAAHARDFATSQRARAVESQAGRFAADAFAEAERKLAEGQSALADRRHEHAIAPLRAAGEAFAQASEAAALGRERERLKGARATLSQLEARAFAADAGALAKAEVAAATKAAALFDKALAGGDLSGAARALAQAERAWREAEAQGARETARRAADLAGEELDQAIAAFRASLARLPAALHTLAGESKLAAIEARTHATKTATNAGDFASAAAAAREGRSLLAKLEADAEKALREALSKRERAFSTGLAELESGGDLELAATLHAEIVTTGKAARQAVAARQYAEATSSLDRAIEGMKTLAAEIATRRAERDRRIEAAERNRRDEPAARDALEALQRARARLSSLGPARGAEAADLAAVNEIAAAAERDAGAGEYAEALPRLRSAASGLAQLCDRLADRQEKERLSTRLGEVRAVATDRSREIALLGGDASNSPEGRRLLASLTTAEEHAGKGDLAAAIRVLEETIPGLEAIVTAQREEIERARRRGAAQSEIDRAGMAREEARGLGERATVSPEFATALAGLEDALRRLESGDFTGASSAAGEAARGFAELAAEIRRAEFEERLAALRSRRRAIDERLAALPAGKALQRPRKTVAKSLAKVDDALAKQSDVEASRLLGEVEASVDSLAEKAAALVAAGPAALDAEERSIPWRMVAIGGGVAAAVASVLWLARGDRTTVARVPVPAETAAPAPTPRPTTAVLPTPATRPTAAPPTVTVPTPIAPPTTAPPTAIPVAPVEPPAPPPLVLASARPAAKSVSLRAGGQQRFDASLKDARDAVLEWRLGGDAVGQGETFVLGKALSEKPGKQTLELVASRGRDHAMLRSWDIEIAAPPLAFGRLDPSSTKLERTSGSRLTFRAPVSIPDASDLSFEWRVNGEPARGAAGSSYEFEPTTPGEYQVAVRATAPWGVSIDNTWKISVRAPAPPPPTPVALVSRPSTDPKAEAQAWIEAYCTAFQTKDTAALIALGHLASEGEASRLRDALSAMTNLRVSCSNSSVRVSGDQAVVSFDRTDHWTDPRGSEMERALPRITKTLRRSSGRWVATP